MAGGEGPCSARWRFFARLCVSVGLGALAGCGGASSGSAGTNPLIATTTSLSATPASVVFGATVTFTAAVLYAPAETASGTVTFFDRGAILGSSTLDPEGIASLKVTTLAVGTHIVTASFPGNSTTAASASAALTVTVTAPPAAKMAATATPSRASTSLPGLGMPIERVVTVQPARETALPSGTVTFEEGSFSLSESRPIHASISNVADTVTYDHPLRLSIRAGERW